MASEIMLIYLLGGLDGGGAPLFAPALAAPTVRVAGIADGALIGLPYALRGPVRSTGGLYIVSPAADAADPQRQAQARALFARLRAEADRVGGAIEAIENLYARLREGHPQYEDRALWSLMLLQWVLDERPAAYLQQRQPLGEAWLQRIVPHDARTLRDDGPRGYLAAKYAAMIPAALIGNVQDTLPGDYRARGDAPACTNIVPDLALISAYEEDAERRALALQFTANVGETYARTFLVAAGLLPAAGSGLLAALVYDLALAYLDLVVALHAQNRAQRDGGDTAEADEAVYDSGTGMTMPFVMRLPVVGRLLRLEDIAVMAYALLELLLAAVMAMIEALARLAAAAAEGFSDWQEFDHDSGWLIPFDDAAFDGTFDAALDADAADGRNGGGP